MLKKRFVLFTFQNEWYFMNYSSAQVRLHPIYNLTRQINNVRARNIFIWELKKVIGDFF